MHFKYLKLATAALFIFTAGCKKKEGPVGPQGPGGPAGPAFYGTIAGHIWINDPYGSRRYQDLDGILVKLNDSITTTTDANGYYIFDSVITGNYNIQISKTGYGSTQTGYTGFVKDTLYKNMKMSAKPLFDLNSFKATYNTGSAYDSVFATFNTDSRSRAWIVFVSNQPSVSPTNHLLAYVRTIPANTSVSAFRIPAYELNNAGIFFGEVAYYAACSYVVNDVSMHEDPVSGKAQYTAVGTAITDSAIAP
jgi:hypothetical protein